MKLKAKTLASLSLVLALVIILISFLNWNKTYTVPEFDAKEEQKVLKLLKTSGVYRVDALLSNSDRFACVLEAGGNPLPIDKYGHAEKINSLRFPWVHGTFAKMGFTADWYWTLIIFDSEDRPRVLRVDKGKDADLSPQPIQRCFNRQDTFFVRSSVAGSSLVNSVSFQ